VNARERPIERLAYGPSEAAAAMGYSREFFDREVLPEVKCIRRGRRIIIDVRELQAWLDRNSRSVLP
jgi:hypothetical protein